MTTQHQKAQLQHEADAAAATKHVEQLEHQNQVCRCTIDYTL